MRYTIEDPKGSGKWRDATEDEYKAATGGRGMSNAASDEDIADQLIARIKAIDEDPKTVDPCTVEELLVELEQLSPEKATLVLEVIEKRE
jgi:hypothetical protein